MYKATNLAIHRTGLPVENKERLVGGAYHISTKYTALYYRSVRITPFGEMWWRCLSYACYHFHFSWKDKYVSFHFVVLHLRSLSCKKLKEKYNDILTKMYLNKMYLQSVFWSKWANSLLSREKYFSQLGIDFPQQNIKV